MNRKNSICFSVILILIVVSIAITLYQKNENIKPREETQLSEVESAMAVPPVCKYCIKEINHQLVVYQGNGGQILFRTSIFLEELPLELQEKIRQGLPFKSEEELYSFLESYSS